MKLTYNWLKDFVDIKLTAYELAKKLTMAGLEVTSLEERGKDFIFEIEITSNRPDWLSVIGVAREIAAITGSKFKVQSSRLKLKNKNEKGPLKITIEDKKDCPLYTAKIIKDVKVGPSPEWLRQRLELIGCRSINNIVDITNYVLFTYGEPLHAFDLDKLKGDTIIVRRALKNEKIVMIDGQKHSLDQEVLIIADKDRPVAVAGIMGGEETQVTENTKNILLEAAAFNPITVRHGRRKLGVQSESAYRFERGVDLGGVDIASSCAAMLIDNLAGGKCILQERSAAIKIKLKDINLSPQNVNKILGVDIPKQQIRTILGRLGFNIKDKTGNFIVKAPSHRADINLEVDVIEEIARIFGYEKIPVSTPAVKPQPRLGGYRDLVALLKNILVSQGANEVITYSLIDKGLLKSFQPQEGDEPIEILNPLSKEQEVLRPTLIPSLCSRVAYNLNQKQEYINIFEVSSVFLKALDKPKEELMLGVALCGTHAFLLERGLVRDDVGFLHLKGIIEVLFRRLGIKDYCFNAEGPLSFSINAGKERIGLMVKAGRKILDCLDIKNKDVFALEISLDKVFTLARLKKKLLPLPRYPGIARDISFILKEGTLLKEVFQVIKEAGGSLLDYVKAVDYYKGKQIPEGHRGITVSCFYRSQERTLTEEEINPIHIKICSILTERFDIKFR